MEATPTSTSPRNPWLAALLSLLEAPLGQVYAGRFRRGAVIWAMVCLLWPILALAVVSLPLGRAALVLLVLCSLAFRILPVVDAFFLARRNRDAPRKQYQRWWVYVLLFVAVSASGELVAYVARAFIAEAFVVPNRPMAPTLEAGDRFFVDKLWTDPSRIRRGDVVAYRAHGPGSPLWVMRVIGLPGDEIEIKEERVFVNGAPWDDQHAVFQEGPTVPEMVNHGPTVVPPGHFFVLGDNRRRASDSRFNGPIPMSDYYGKVSMIYWSQARTYPDPEDTSDYTEGRVRWERIGRRLD